MPMTYRELKDLLKRAHAVLKNSHADESLIAEIEAAIARKPSIANRKIDLADLHRRIAAGQKQREIAAALGVGLSAIKMALWREKQG